MLSFISLLLCAAPVCLAAGPHAGARRLVQDDSTPAPEPTPPEASPVPDVASPPAPASASTLPECFGKGHVCISDDRDCCEGMDCRIQSSDKGVCTPYADYEAACSGQGESCKEQACCGLGETGLFCGENEMCDTGKPTPPTDVCVLEGRWCEPNPNNSLDITPCCSYGPGYVTCSMENLCERSEPITTTKPTTTTKCDGPKPTNPTTTGQDCSNQGESCDEKACCGEGKNSLWCGEDLKCEYTGFPAPPIPGMCQAEGLECDIDPTNDPKNKHCCRFGPGHVTCSSNKKCERTDGKTSQVVTTPTTPTGDKCEEMKGDDDKKGGPGEEEIVNPPNGCSNQGESCDEKACCGEGKNSLWCGEDLKCEYTGFPPPPIPGMCQAEGLECDIDDANDPKNKHCCRFGPGHVTCSSKNKCERTDGKTSGNTGSTTSSTSTNSGGTSSRTVEASKSGCVSTGGLGIMSAAGLLAAFAI